jgi:hypothetical protein
MNNSIVQDVEGKDYGPAWGTILAFAWRCEENNKHKTSVRTSGVPVKIRTGHLQNTSQNCYGFLSQSP